MSVECFLSVLQNILTVCFLLLNLQQNVQSMSPEFTIRPPLTVIN